MGSVSLRRRISCCARSATLASAHAGWRAPNWRPPLQFFQLAGLQLGADYIVRIFFCRLYCAGCIVRIVSCGLYRADCFVRIVSYELYHADCIVRTVSSELYRADCFVRIVSCGLSRGIALLGCKMRSCRAIGLKALTTCTEGGRAMCCLDPPLKQACKTGGFIANCFWEDLTYNNVAFLYCSL